MSTSEIHGKNAYGPRVLPRLGARERAVATVNDLGFRSHHRGGNVVPFQRGSPTTHAIVHMPSRR